MRMRVPLALLAALAAAGVAARADEEHDRALSLRQHGEILPLAAILGQIAARRHGRVLEAELEEKGGRIVYEIELLGPDDIVREMTVDAKTGRVLSVEDE